MLFTVGPNLEKKIAESIQQSEQGTYLALDPVSHAIDVSENQRAGESSPANGTTADRAYVTSYPYVSAPAY